MYSQSTGGGSDLSSRNVHATQLGGLSVGQLVHGCFSDVESSAANIDRNNINRLPASLGIGISQLPAGPTGGRIPPGDGRGTPEVRESRKRTKGGESTGQQPVRPIRASYCGKRLSTIVVDRVIADGYGLTERSRDESEEDKAWNLHS